MTVTASPSQIAYEEKNPLHELYILFSDKIIKVDQCLDAYAYSDVRALPLISKHIISSGGKRIRPLLTLAAASLCGYTEGDRDVSLAACIEFLHTATLLHDDVVDESKLRRGAPTAHTLWGNQMSVLTGDFLFSKLFQQLIADGDLNVLKLFSETTQKIIEGEVLQISARSNSNLSKEDYFLIIELKTALLFGAALELGGMVAEASQKQSQALKTYAYNIGMAFQLIDDVLDYTASEPKLGKPIGNDFFEGQPTLVLILLQNRLRQNPTKLNQLQHILSADCRSNDDFKWVQRLIHEHRIDKEIYDLAETYVEQARTALYFFNDSPLRKVLICLANFIVGRPN
jgi:octaprenyl-diphosphate synthase